MSTLAQSTMVNTVDNKDKILDIIESLQPTGEDYDDNTRFYHWLEYACELDMLAYSVWDGKGADIVAKRLTQLSEGSPQHDAITDVMLTANERGYTIV